MKAIRDYVVCAPNEDYFYEHFEMLVYEKKKMKREAKEVGNRLIYEIINPNGMVSDYLRIRRQRHLSEIRSGKFQTLILKGAVVTPYIGTLLRSVPQSVLVFNQSVPHSQLDSWILMRDFKLEYRE